MKLNFAKRMSYIKASEIREILKVTEQEDVISFAGGLPAPELFPIDEINEINQIVLKEAVRKRSNILQQKVMLLCANGLPTG